MEQVSERARDMEAVVERILDESLGIETGERYLFFTDFNSPFEERFAQLVERRMFLHEFFEAFVHVSDRRKGGVGDKCESTRRHGGEPGENIWKHALGEEAYWRLVERDLLWKLKGEVPLNGDEASWLDSIFDKHRDEFVDAVVAFPWYSVTHTRFTRILVKRGCRFASMPMLTPGVLDGPMRASWVDVAAITKQVYEMLLDCDGLELTCPLGTRFTVRLGGRELIHQDTGLLRERGSLGNLPAGEAYFVPESESAEGILVFTSGPDRPSVEPTKVVVERGQVSFCENDTEYSKFLDMKFEGDPGMRHIAEVGIGTNPMARDIGSMIEGEKIQGTVHVALGDDTAMGGRNEAGEHWDHVLTNVTLKALLRGGGERILVGDGRLSVSE